MATSADWLIKALFKPTTGGWVYRAPNPWIVGRPTHYLVSDAQLTELIEALTRKRPLLLALCLSTLVGGWILFFSAAMWFGYRFERPTVLEAIMMIVLIVVPAVGAIAVNAAAMRKSISAIVAGAPVTQETITYREIRAAFARQQPKRATGHFIGIGCLWVFLGILQVVQLVERHMRHPLAGDPLSYLTALVLVLAIWLATTHFVHALRSYQDAHRTG